MPTTPKIRPLAASENATGYPSSRTKTSATNMIGAMLAMNSAVILDSPDAKPQPSARLGLDLDVLDQALGFLHDDFMRGVDLGVGDQAAHDGEPLDELGEPLNEQQEEADEHQRLRRPLRQAAGIHRLLVDLVGADEERQAGDDQEQRERQQKKHVADDVDDVAHLLWEHIVHDVDADVLVDQERPGRAQQEHRAVQHPLQLEP